METYEVVFGISRNRTQLRKNKRLLNDNRQIPKQSNGTSQKQETQAIKRNFAKTRDPSNQSQTQETTTIDKYARENSADSAKPQQ